MSDNVMIGGNCKELKTGAQLQPYTAVVLTVEGKEQFRAEMPGETGKTLTVECPWGSEEIARQVLTQVGGYTYQPYKASGTKIDPAVELGDAVNTYDVHEGMFAQDITFGRQMRSNAEAPGQEDTDHEFPYVPPNTRRMQRLGAAVGGMGARVTELEEEWTGILTDFADLTARVVDVEAGIQSAVRVEQKRDADGNLVYDDEGNPVWETKSANASFFAAAGDVKASLSLKADVSTVSGLSRSVATLSADVVDIKAFKTNIENKLTVGDVLTVKENLNVGDALDVGGNVDIDGYLHVNGIFRYGGRQVESREITSFFDADGNPIQSLTVLCT